jgi:N-acetylneuraminic acid mutarotase
MNKIIPVILLLLASLSGKCQQNWTMIKGNAYELPNGYYSAAGVTDIRNNPGGREYAATWSYNNKLYLFGGRGIGGVGSGVGMLNDLWVFDSATNNWTFLKGSSVIDQMPDYGTMGVEASTNIPSGRTGCVTWVYGGKLYLLGGSGKDQAGAGGALNDFWVYDPITNNWTWLAGSVLIYGTGSYGTINVPAASNYPPATRGAVSWTYEGKFYMFGGNNSSGNVNAMWVYDPVTTYWTWIKGSSTLDAPGSYGAIGVTTASNVPWSRSNAIAWLCGSKFYVFGGIPSGGVINDLWRYDPATNNWTLLKGSNVFNDTGYYGIMNVASSINSPACRNGSASWSLNGYLYLYGGSDRDDLWRFDTVTGNWTWIGGHRQTRLPGNYTTPGTFLAYNTPGGRYASFCWVQNNRAYLFGGRGFAISAPPGAVVSPSYCDDLWTYDLASGNWAWLKGHENPNFASFSSTTSLSTVYNTPSARMGNVTWQLHDTVYIYSGGDPRYDDLWRYVISTNTWKKLRCTDSMYQVPVYGTAGMSSPSNTPGARTSCSGWTYNNKLYLFGGGNPFAAYNDLWEYDPTTNNWTWIMGSSIAGVWGTMGVASPSNIPGPRVGSTCFAYNNKFYLFGGQGLYSGPTATYYNDLWQYDPATHLWTWLKGSNTAGAYGAYGTMGVATPATTPGSRGNATGWVCNNKFYVFGGWGRSASPSAGEGRLCDLWEYDPPTNVWRWLKGRNYITYNGVYGTLGTGAPTSFPGPRIGASGLTHNNAIYLFGGDGYGFDGLAPGGMMSDIWKYDPVAGNWIWTGGSNEPGQPGICNIIGVTDPSNRIGGRTAASGWTYNNLFYLWGGLGQAVGSPYETARNDIWTYQPCPLASCYSVAPTVNISAPVTCGIPVVELNAGNPGCTYLWSTGETTPVIYAPTPGSYSVTVTNAYGLSTTATTTLSSSVLPIVSLGNDTALCPGSSLTLDALNPGYLFSWNTGATSQTITASMPGTYSVTVTSPWGCSAADSIAFTFYPNPVVSLGHDTDICAGSSISLASLSTGGSTYLWNTGATTSSISVSSAGSYWLQVTDIHGCIGRDTASISINPTPVVALGNDTSVCMGNNIILDALNPGAFYFWSTSATTQMISVSTTGTYHVVVTDSNGCVGNDTINLAFTSLPIVNLGSDTSICIGSSIALDAHNPGGTYLWSTAATTSMISAASAGSYDVAVTDADGCVGRDTIAINLLSMPTAGSITAALSGETDYSFGSGGTTGGLNYHWSFGDGDTSILYAPSHTYAAGGTYTVTFTVSNNCGSDTSQKIIAISTNATHNVTLQQLQLFPNPSSRTVYVSYDLGNIVSLAVYDIQGSLVYVTNELNKKRAELDVSGWTSGIYQVNIATTDGTVVKKLCILK